MRTTTVRINEKLLDEASRILKTDTITETVDRSLRFVVRQSRLRALAGALGTIDLDLTPESLRQQRRKRTRHVSR
jgi:Arc/MetJ family transcription regulator